MRRIVADLYLKDRTIVCDGYDESLNYLQRHLPFRILEYSSGQSYWKWIVPQKYTVREAYIQDMISGRRVIDVRDHPLHLACYSSPFQGELSYEELKKNLCWNEQVPEAIPYFYKFQYRPWEKNWRFCLSHDQLRALDPLSSYFVMVDTVFEHGTMKVAEFFKQGKVNDTILMVSHLDHPGQVNDGLSGVVVELALMKELLHQKTHYSYLFLIVPEFFGSVAYLNQPGKRPEFKMGFFTEMLTTGLDLQLQKSLMGDTYIDRLAEMVFRDHLDRYRIVEYLKGVGNDEIVFESPGVEIPFISIHRAREKDKLYKQYHTHLDNIDMVDENQLAESLDLLCRLIHTLENDAYVRRTFEGFICLSNPDLDIYFNKDDDTHDPKRLTDEAVQRFHDFQFGGFRFLDGNHRISDIARRYALPFDLMRQYLHKMEAKSLVAFSMEPFSGA
jgi:aminopeptidase-like protein